MRRSHRFSLACLILVTACAHHVDNGAEAPPDDAASLVTSLADAYVDAYFEAFPYHALIFGAPDTRPEALADHSLAALERWQRQEDGMLAALREVDAGALNGTPAALTYGFLKNQLEAAVGFRTCRMGVLSGVRGWPDV